MSEPRGKPTLNEAVSFLMKCATREYRAACLDDWRTKFGDAFADSVKAGVVGAWKK